MIKEPQLRPIALIIQHTLISVMAEQYVILCNPFNEYSDVREKASSRLNLAKVCVKEKFKGTKLMERVVCS